MLSRIFFFIRRRFYFLRDLRVPEIFSSGTESRSKGFLAFLYFSSLHTGPAMSNNQQRQITALRLVSKDLVRSLKKIRLRIRAPQVLLPQQLKTHFLLCTSLYQLSQKSYFAIVFRFLCEFYFYVYWASKSAKKRLKKIVGQKPGIWTRVSLGITGKRGAEYLIITKDRLVLVSAPYASS